MTTTGILARALGCALSMGVASAHAVQSSTIDRTPPRLVAFSLSAPADVASPFGQLSLDVRATDDLSGVVDVVLQLIGPHGQTISLRPSTWWLPARDFHQTVAADATAYVEPGTWTALGLTLWDLEGNAANYDAGQLAGFGQPAVQVVNSRAELADFTPPKVVLGWIKTPVVSASGHARGTDRPPFVLAQFVVHDAGSGAAQAKGIWCLADLTSCLYPAGFDSIRAQRQATIDATDGLYGPTPPGTYYAYTLQVTDHAGNVTALLASRFGGETDFSTLFPAGSTITVVP